MHIPKVSIILPTFNGEKYIREAIDSILIQDMKDWELIVVDDCSTDNTMQILEDYVDLDSRIRVIHNEKNQKLPASLNIGFSEAQGNYLTWTSDDNRYAADALRIMVEYLEDNSQINMVCAGMLYIDSDGEITGVHNEFKLDDIYWENYVGACFLYRNRVLQDVGKYDETLFGIEDYDYWVRIYQRYGTIGYIPKALYYYRRHENNLTNQRKDMVRRQRIEFRKKHLEFICKQKVKRKEVLMRVYYELLYLQDENRDLLNMLSNEFEELACDQFTDDKKNYIVFGAGKFGDKVFSSFGKRIAFFADSDMKKVGTLKNGIPVITVTKMEEFSDDYHIIVAADLDRLINMILQVYELGIRDYCSAYGLYATLGGLKYLLD